MKILHKHNRKTKKNEMSIKENIKYL